MAGNYWIKLYTEILDDPKMAMLDDHLWRRFYEFCLVAGKHNKGGLLPTVDQMAWLLRVSAKDLQDDVTNLVEIGLLTEDNGYTIVTNFSKRQTKMSDAERQVKYRSALHKEEYYCNEPVTERNTTALRNVTQITDNRIDNREEGEEKKKVTPPAPSFSINQTGDGFVTSVFSAVTGMTAIPGGDLPKVLPAIDALRSKFPTVEGMTAYLKPYYEFWQTKKTKDGRPFSKSNCAWLYDWAVAGDPLPTDKKPNNARPDPTCPACKGLGLTRKDLDVHDPNFGKLVKCDCVKVREEVEV